MEQLKALGFKGQMIIMVVVMAAIGFGGYKFWPNLEQLDKTIVRKQQKLDELNTEITKGLNLEKKLPELEREIATLEAQLEQLKTIMPPNQIDSEIVSKFEQLAGRSRLSRRPALLERVIRNLRETHDDMRQLREKGLRPVVPELEARPDSTGRSHDVLRPKELPDPRSGGGLRRADGKQPVLRTDVLGVYLSADAAEGKVLVEAVSPGTIADALRLRAGDTILELNGMEVLDSDDIRRVLERRFDGEEVRVKVLTGTGEEEILVWSPR